MKDDNLSEGEIIVDEKSVSTGFFLSRRIHDKLKKHVFMRKTLDVGNSTMKSWLLNAIEKKIEKDKKERLLQSPDVQITLYLPKKYLEQIDKTVSHAQKLLKTSYSRTKWFVDAIEEELEEELSTLEEEFKNLEN